METVSLTITGQNLGELAAKAMTFAQTAQEGIKLGAATTTTKKAKKSAPAATVDADDELAGDIEAEEDELSLEATSDEDTEMGFDDEEEVEEAPKKATKSKKLTDKDVNAAALAHAKKYTRPKTLELLKKKFKVASISELKPEMYGKVIEALKV